ncbi:unnamed protein product [Caenorhabditis bovis]|uniref:Glycoprotein n=1 Tax=Caenorhabditis bovis TaxID=2654633 RepID=A0A8S1EY46_9PELO|nr:unnamed protein product [Caenorhabditis bovis]
MSSEAVLLLLIPLLVNSNLAGDDNNTLIDTGNGTSVTTEEREPNSSQESKPDNSENRVSDDDAPQSVLIPAVVGSSNANNLSDSFVGGISLGCGNNKGIKTKNIGFPDETTDYFTPCVVYPHQVVLLKKKMKIKSNCRPIRCTGSIRVAGANFSEDVKKYSMDGVAKVLDFDKTVESKKAVRYKPSEPMFDAEMPHLCNQFTYDDVETQLAIFNEPYCHVDIQGQEGVFELAARYTLDNNFGVFDIYGSFYGEKEELDYMISASYGSLLDSYKMDGLEYKQCDLSCDRGTILKYTFKKDAVWFLEFYVKRSTDFVKLCFDPEFFTDTKKIPKCRPDRIMTILLRNGLVIWPDNDLAVRMRFGASARDIVQEGTPTFYNFAIIFTPLNGKNQLGLFTRYRQSSFTGSDGYNPKTFRQVAVFLPSEDSLLDNFGIIPTNMEAAMTLVKTSTNVKRVDASKKVFDKKELEKTFNQSEREFTSTKPPAPIPKSTTAPPEIVYIKDSISEHSREYSSQFKKGKWLLFGIYLGFVIGTLSIVLVGGVIFYFFRRTFYITWYRAMFKRYACDASGKTGGVTGVGFGTEITGEQTIGQTSMKSTMETSGGGDSLGL